MSKILVALACVLALARCADGRSPARPLASMKGTLRLANGVQAPQGDMRLSIVWHGAPGEVATDAAASCNSASLVTLRGETALLSWPLSSKVSFPEKFSAELTEPPPAQALRPHGDARSSVGTLVVYRDVNTNGRLDFGDVGVASPDEILGSGDGDLPTLSTNDAHSVEYLTKVAGIQPLGFQLSAGYNLRIAHDDPVTRTTVESARPLDDSVEVQLTVGPNHYLQRFACADLCRVRDQTLCPADPAQLPDLQALGEAVPGTRARWVYTKEAVGHSVFYDGQCGRDATAAPGGTVREQYELSIDDIRSCETTYANCVYERGKLPAGVDIPCTQFDSQLLPP
ncbi:MAG TPA: hypothetical protein VF331_24615 [Polyangiales bacterium]